MRVIHAKQKSNHKLGQSLKYCFLFLALFTSVSATTYGFVNGSASADTKNTDFTVNIRPVMNLTTSANQVSLNLNPASHVSDSQSISTTVSTNNSNGYQLYISASGSSLVEKNNSSLIIPTLPASETGYASLADFPANHWGYKLNDGNFQAFEPDVLIGSATGPTSSASATVEFGAKIDYGTKAGQYELALNFKALPIVTQTYIQDVTPDFCTTDPQVVIDNRDEQVYTIQRLADGNCWMLDNLRLGSTSTISLTPSDTNIASNWTLPASGTVCFSSSSCTGTSGATGTGYTVSAINTASKDVTTTSYGSGSGKIGVYYNYCAASAGTYCYASGSGTGNASYDICPKGWRMPTGASGGEYQALYTAYSSNATNFRNALSTPLSGYFYVSSADSQGSYGRFWSSTYNGGYNMYYLYVSSSGVYPTSNNSRDRGNSVRCLLK